MVFHAVFISTLHYTCETWILYRKDLIKLERFQQVKFRQILNIKWQERHTNNKVVNNSEILSIEAATPQASLQVARTCHLNEDYRGAILYSELVNSKQHSGAQNADSKAAWGLLSFNPESALTLVKNKLPAVRDDVEQFILDLAWMSDSSIGVRGISGS